MKTVGMTKSRLLLPHAQIKQKFQSFAAPGAITNGGCLWNQNLLLFAAFAPDTAIQSPFLG